MKKKTPNPLLLLKSSEELSIPFQLTNNQAASYTVQLQRRFKKIIAALQKQPQIQFAPTSKPAVISNVIEIQTSLLQIIKTYLDGFPAIAYNLFQEMIEAQKLEEDLFSILQIREVQNTSFFRIQKSRYHSKKPLASSEGFLKIKEPFELFHPPFQRRRSIPTSRYSISGYPSLYLADDLHTCYSECFFNEPEFVPFHAVLFQNIRPLYFVDLSSDVLFTNNKFFEGLSADSSDEEDITGFLENLAFYHLIIACHTKIQYTPKYLGETFHFKVEYIIPQFILQWLKNKGSIIDGIRYKSCTVNTTFKEIADTHYSYVMPVKTSLKNGFCPKLSSLFKATDVYSYLRQTVSDKYQALHDVTNTLRAVKTSPLCVS